MLTQEREKRTIVVLHGDQTGEELLHEALRVLNSAVLCTDLSFRHFDLSLDNRRATKNHVVEGAADAMTAVGFGLKAATISPETIGDVGSPNTILRERIGGSVIVRTGQRISGVPSVAGVRGPIAVVRMAVGDAYGAQEWREGQDLDEIACRTERITRWHCRAVAEYACHAASTVPWIVKVREGPI
jgi:isocitrate dehydrogenase